MKITDKIKHRVRVGLWVASLAWGAYFLVYALLMMPALYEILRWLWPGGGFPVWATMVFYVLVVLTGILIFFWYFAWLWKKK